MNLKIKTLNWEWAIAAGSMNAQTQCAAISLEKRFGLANTVPGNGFADVLLKQYRRNKAKLNITQLADKLLITKAPFNAIVKSIKGTLNFKTLKP
jgi:hypothetical protein